MAIETEPAVAGTNAAAAGFDPAVIRRDFPILQQEINGHPLVYLDSASTSQKPTLLTTASRG